MYWLFRKTINSFESIFLLIKTLAILAIISAPLIAAENIRQSSFYSTFGPVGSAFHRGRFRCAGPFPHYIMMGSFWASILPFFYAMAKSGTQSFFYWVAIGASITCVYFSASSTPILTIVSLIIFWFIYDYRIYGKNIFLLTIFFLFLLHIVMNAPVWHLIARVDIFGGSTGWHRYHLLDNFLRHWSDWLILGTKSTAEWGYGLGDITNQFVLEAVRGGAITLLIFVLLMYEAVKISGKFSIVTQEKSHQILGWAVCVSLLGHVVTFFGVSYFGQINILLYVTFSIVSFLYETMNSAPKQIYCEKPLRIKILKKGSNIRLENCM
jgi:hypothetical protein